MNPNSTRTQAAIIRDQAAHVSDPLRREAMENGANNLDKLSTAIPALRAVMAIYDVFPDVKFDGVRESK